MYHLSREPVPVFQQPHCKMSLPYTKFEQCQDMLCIKIFFAVFISPFSQRFVVGTILHILHLYP